MILKHQSWLYDSRDISEVFFSALPPGRFEALAIRMDGRAKETWAQTYCSAVRELKEFDIEAPLSWLFAAWWTIRNRWQWFWSVQIYKTQAFEVRHIEVRFHPPEGSVPPAIEPDLEITLQGEKTTLRLPVKPWRLQPWMGFSIRLVAECKDIPTVVGLRGTHEIAQRPWNEMARSERIKLLLQRTLYHRWKNLDPWTTEEAKLPEAIV